MTAELPPAEGVLGEESLDESAEGLEPGWGALDASSSCLSLRSSTESLEFSVASRLLWLLGTNPVIGEDKKWAAEMESQICGFFRRWGEEIYCSVQQLPAAGLRLLGEALACLPVKPGGSW